MCVCVCEVRIIKKDCTEELQSTIARLQVKVGVHADPYLLCMKIEGIEIEGCLFFCLTAREEQNAGNGRRDHSVKIRRGHDHRQV